MKTLPKLYRGLRTGFTALVVVTLSAAATSFPAATSADALPRLPLPPDAELSPLGDRLRINGQEARLHELRFPGSIDALLAFYRQQFGGTVSEPGQTPGQRIVGGLVGNSYVTVQISDGPDRSPDAPIQARILQTLLLPSYADTRPAPAPMPIDSRTLSDIETQDGTRLARLRVYGNRHSLDANVAFVQRQFASHGLVPVDRGMAGDATQTLLWFADEHGGEAMVAVHNNGDLWLVTVHTVAQLPVFEVQR